MPKRTSDAEVWADPRAEEILECHKSLVWEEATPRPTTRKGWTKYVRGTIKAIDRQGLTRARALG